MPIKTEETFQLKAPADRVWSYLVDPRNVVTCLPGAELTSVQDESTFLGKVKVKVGPVVAAYSGKVVITERDDSARIVKMVGEGRESAGSGSAKVAITSSVVDLSNGMTEVRVTADLDIVGKIAQFGRGMIESVNKQMFRQFTECVRATLEAPNVETGRGVQADAPVRATAASDPTAPAATASPATAGPANAATAPAFATAKPVRLLPVIGRAIWEYVTALVRRLLGRRTETPR